MNDKISIIVPIYNTEKYLKKCIESIIGQTYKNLEIILIDDGSTDNSKKICEEYEKKDSRIIFISKNNTGVSDTRNEGLKIATGKYIGFVDSDDYIEKEMFEILHRNINIYNADISIVGCDSKNSNYITMTKNKEQAMKLILEENGPQGYLCNKLYKKSIIEEYGIKLNDKIFICEDLLFNSYYLSKVNKAVYTDQKLYNYVTRYGSACNQKFNYKWISILDAYDKMNEIYKTTKNEIYDYFKAVYVLANINLKTKMYLSNEVNESIKKRCDCNINKYLKDVFKSRENSYKIKLKVFCYYYFHGIINLLKLLKQKLRRKNKNVK